jgi:hypothetical protein
MTHVDRRRLRRAPMSPGRSVTPLWRVKRMGIVVCCFLKQTADNAFILSVTINGDEIAARRYSTKEAAGGDAVFLLESLATGGWTVVVGTPEPMLQ